MNTKSIGIQIPDQSNVDELKEIIADLNELNFQPTEGNDLRKEESRLTHVEKLFLRNSN